MRSHLDRRATTLATIPADDHHQELALQPPGRGAHDCRIDLKLLQWRALRAAGRSAAARARLDAFDPMMRPDLWAGTVQDGTARGFMVALEEAVALGPNAAPPQEAPDDPTRMQTFTGSQLRKKRDLVVESKGSRIRFSRKEGVLFVDRDAGVNSPNSLRFEARSDRGTLDGFAGDENERPRIFSAQFLDPVRYVAGAGWFDLLLGGRLGRTSAGFDCLLQFTGSADEPFVRMRIRIDNRHDDHRLRARFLGVPSSLLHHDCTDVHEEVENAAGGFVAFTLIRACGRLLVSGTEVAVPGAQCRGVVEHTFRLGSDAGVRD